MTMQVPAVDGICADAEPFYIAGVIARVEMVTTGI